MDELRFLLDKLRGRETVMRVKLLGESVRLAIAARREITRARSFSGERELLERMLDHLEPSDTVYDVGANMGLVSLVVACHPSGTAGRVHSFEPEPTNFRQLSRNIELNRLTDRILPHRLALGADDGEAELFVRRGAGEGRHSIATAEGATASIRVPLTTLSGFARASGEPPQLVKIDVEGAEGQVLAGMDALIQDNRPRELFLEIHPKGGGDRMPGGMSIDDWLDTRGFSRVWERRHRSRVHRHYR